MEIFSSSNLKKNNVKYLMKQEQIKIALSKLFSNNIIKWNNISIEKSIRAINITNVNLSKDYNKAIIHVTLYSYINESDYSIDNIVNCLNKEVVTIKHYLKNMLKLRKVPSLFFKIDKENISIKKVNSILDNLTYSNNDNN